jgi:electron transfer flavoprotein alpha subunit
LILTRPLAASATTGLLGMLVARELGLQFVPAADALSVRFTEDEASALVWSGGRTKPQRLSLPVALGMVACGDVPRFRITDFLASLERTIKFVAWPEEITRRFVSLASSAAATQRAADVSVSSRAMTPDQAAGVLLESLGLRAEPAADRSDESLHGPIHSIDRLTVRQPGSVLVVAAVDASGRLRPAERRLVRTASALARQRSRPLVALVFAPSDEDAQRRVASELARLGASTVTLASTDQTPEPKRAGEVWSRILMDRWSPDWNAFAAIVASVWAEPVLARFGSRQAELIFRVSEMTPGPNTFIARSPRAEGKVDSLRDLPTSDSKPLWITTTENVDCDLPPLVEIREPTVECWPVDVAQLPSRRELMELLGQVRDEAGLARLSDADFIIDVGFGIGSGDGFEEIVPPLEKLLREIGVAHIVLGASRKVTEELKVLPAGAQIGQTGQSVNPAILLAIGISGAPQHLNYIGQRATILAFNRDPEAPIMTLNQRQPRPRVFPIVGDLFQTVPAFMAALREREHSQRTEAEPSLA